MRKSLISIDVNAANNFYAKINHQHICKHFGKYDTFYVFVAIIKVETSVWEKLAKR